MSVDGVWARPFRYFSIFDGGRSSFIHRSVVGELMRQ
jgi:hypothetical protein